MDIDFSPAIWAQERNFLYVSSLQAGSTHVLVEVVGHSELSAKYAIPPSHSVDVDITDVVRMYETGTFKVSELSGDTVVEEQTPDPWLRAGLINPANLIIPETELADEAGGAPILPPSKMLVLPGIRVVAECFLNSLENWSLNGATWDTIQRRGIVVGGDFTLENVENGHREYQTTLVSRCLPFIIVIWTSCTGAQRIHIFEVVQQDSEAIDAVEMLTVDNSYDIRKGRRESMTIKLDGLSRYDLWYYADMLMSSNVKVVDIKSTQQPILHNHIHNMDDRRIDDYYVISGGWFETAQGSITVEGVVINQCLRFEEGAYISFNAEKEGTIKLYFNQISDGAVIEVQRGGTRQLATVQNGYAKINIPSGGDTVIRTSAIAPGSYVPSLYYVAFEYYTYTEIIEEGKTFAAEITDKKVELPATDEGALSTLEVSLNYSRYDSL